MDHEQRWETIEELGRGGQSVVWLAQEKEAYKSVWNALSVSHDYLVVRPDVRKAK
jgi:hypothetical protein